MSLCETESCIQHEQETEGKICSAGCKSQIFVLAATKVTELPEYIFAHLRKVILFVFLASKASSLVGADLAQGLAGESKWLVLATLQSIAAWEPHQALQSWVQVKLGFLFQEQSSSVVLAAPQVFLC